MQRDEKHIIEQLSSHPVDTKAEAAAAALLSPADCSGIDIDPDLCCPITSVLMSDPVVTADDQPYEREAIEEWLRFNDTSPATNDPLPNKNLTPNVFAKRSIQRFLDRHPALRDSTEYYFPTQLKVSLAQAIASGNVNEMTRLCEQDRRLLVLPFSLPNQANETSALHLAAVGSHALVLTQILTLMERRQAGLASAALKRSIESVIPLQAALRASSSPAVIAGVLRAMGPGLPDAIGITLPSTRQGVLDHVVTAVISDRGGASLDVVGQQIKLCLSAGALPGGKDSQGCGLLHRAARADDVELIRWSLESQGAEIGLKSHAGQTALHAAAEVGAVHAMGALLAAGIEPGIEDNGGQTAAALARSRGQGTWAERLEKCLAAQAERQQSLLENEGLVGLTLLRMQQSVALQQAAMKEMTAKFAGLLLQLTETREVLSQTQGELSQTQSRLSGAESKLSQTQGELSQTRGELSQTQSRLSGAESKLSQTQGRLSRSEHDLKQTQGELRQTQQDLRALKQKSSGFFSAYDRRLAQEAKEAKTRELQAQVPALLSLVASGEQSKAEQLIARDPEILLLSGDVTDGAGRTFTNITALQYAVWALDAHMWTMILPYFDRLSARGTAGDQLRQLEEKGTAHGGHFDFKPLLDAYAAYQRSPSEERWCRGVGGAQRLLPDHVIQEYTTPDRPFSPVPDFSVHCGRPVVHGERGVKWMRTATFLFPGGGRIGTSWAAVRGRRRQGGQRPLPINRKEARHDEAAITALCSQRSQDLSALLAAFSIMPSQAPESKSPGRRGWAYHH